MNCIHPVDCWRCGKVSCKADGVISCNLVFSSTDAYTYFAQHYGKLAFLAMERNHMVLPCGKCKGCQLDKRKDMTTKLVHEASCYDYSCFLTLTYDDAHLPVTDWRPLSDKEKSTCRGLGELPEPTLSPRDLTLFLKRLRRHLDYHYGAKIRYFAVGEYGSKRMRPHYHILIFGWLPKDMVKWEFRNGYWLYRSNELESLWTHGFSTVGLVNVGVAKYCARYVTKKFTHLDFPLGDAYVVPEFIRQSTRIGGMGIPWFKRNYRHVLESGLCSYLSARGDVCHAAIPKSYLRNARKYHLSSWLGWRDRAIQYHGNHPVTSDLYETVRHVECFYYELRKEAELEEL